MRREPRSRSIFDRFSDPRTLTKYRACHQNQAFSTFALNSEMAPKNDSRGPHFRGARARVATKRASRGTPKILDRRFLEFFGHVFFCMKICMKKNEFFGEIERRPAQCAGSAGGKEGCISCITLRGFAGRVHANHLMQKFHAKFIMQRSWFRN